MQTRLEALGERRIRLMPIFGVRRAHVRLDLRTLTSLFAHLFPKDPNVLELARLDKEPKLHRDPDLYLLPSPPCTREPGESMPDFQARQQARQVQVDAVKATEKYRSSTHQKAACTWTGTGRRR
jgi:hypothetical protein